MSGAETLLDDYNHYRFQTHNIRRLRGEGKPIGSVSRKNMPQFQALESWCREKGVEPRRWLASLFESRHWLFAPPLNQLKSTKHLQRYPNMGAIPAYQARMRQEQVTRQFQNGEVFDPNRDISNGAECLKRRYLAFGRPEQCMAGMMTETFGYHPKSKECARCPIQQACAQRLRTSVRFDIMALREGRMTAEQAQAWVHYGRGN